MSSNLNIETKYIVMDEPTSAFLTSLRELRKLSGFTQQDLADFLGTSRSNIYYYERGINRPPLAALFKLASLFGVDLSESINYKFFYRSLSAYDIKHRAKNFGLSQNELGGLTSYREREISETVNMRPRASVACFAAILEVLEHESKSLRMRNFMLQKGRRLKDG
ncbi:MAG: helix-turn-helix transcriptional regulator [Synergistaceae bacterium]|nr:helix-turn-helix transcriptional regulator [Synergistaceae bacterium]